MSHKEFDTIEGYSPGRIVIDSKTYTSDLILYPDKIDDSWWRKSSHLLLIEDLYDVLTYEPESKNLQMKEGIMEIAHWD